MSNKQCLFGNDGHQTWPLSFSHHHLSFPPPPTMLITAANNAHHHQHPLWLPMNANNHQQLQRHHNQPKNEDSRPQTTTNTHPTNDGLDPWTDMGGDKRRWVNLPLLTLHFIHMEYRCHVMLVMWQPNDEQWCWQHCCSLLFLISDTTVSITCPMFVPIHLAETQDDDNPAQQHNADMRWQRGHKTRMWPRQEAMRTCDEDTWGHMATRRRQHFPFHITPTSLPLTSPSL